MAVLRWAGASNRRQQLEDLSDSFGDADFPIFAGLGVEPDASEVLVAMHRTRDCEVDIDLFPLLRSQPNPFRRHRLLLFAKSTTGCSQDASVSPSSACRRSHGAPGELFPLLDVPRREHYGPRAANRHSREVNPDDRCNIFL